MGGGVVLARGFGLKSALCRQRAPNPNRRPSFAVNMFSLWRQALPSRTLSLPFTRLVRQTLEDEPQPSGVGHPFRKGAARREVPRRKVDALGIDARGPPIARRRPARD